MYNGVQHAVMSMLHRTQGRQAGFVQTVLRNLSNNSSTAVKFRSTDSVEFCHTTNKPFEFSYVDGDHFHFIDPETYDDIVLMKETIGDDVKWLVEGVQYNILFVDGNPVLIVAAGDTKIDNPKFKAQFHQKASMIPAERVEELVGHAVGGVCPFAINDGVTVYLDRSLQRFQTVFPACGSANSAIELTIPELEKYSGFSAWVDVCKGWE